jgi:hypothetical protein
MESILALMIPITFILMIVFVVLGPIWIINYFKARDRAQMHETLRVAYEKGQPVPPELIASLQAPPPAETAPQPSVDSDLRRGIVLVAVGLGLVGLGYGFWYGFMIINEIPAYLIGGMVAGSGAIPGFIGLAYLILWLGKRGTAKA